MIRPQRNTHRKIWVSMALLLPTGIIFSWLAIPNPVPVKLLPVVNASQLPEIKGTKETLQYCINIRTDSTKNAWQLEWKNKLALAVPSAVIYQGTHIDSAQLIGRIEARGDYLFTLRPGSDSAVCLFVYDFIHEKIIDSINIKIL